MRIDGGGGYGAITGSTYAIKTAAVTPCDVSQYSATEIEQMFSWLDPAAAEQAGSAHTAASRTLTDIADSLVKHVQVLNDSWSGTAAKAAVGNFQQLHETAIGLARASAQTGSVLSWLGTEILPFYKNYKAPGNGIMGDLESLVGHNPQNSAAQQVMARLNNRLVQANSGLPASVTKYLSIRSAQGGHSAATSGGVASGGTGAVGGLGTGGAGGGIGGLGHGGGVGHGGVGSPGGGHSGGGGLGLGTGPGGSGGAGGAGGTGGSGAPPPGTRLAGFPPPGGGSGAGGLGGTGGLGGGVPGGPAGPGGPGGGLPGGGLPGGGPGSGFVPVPGGGSPGGPGEGLGGPGETGGAGGLGDGPVPVAGGGVPGEPGEGAGGPGDPGGPGGAEGGVGSEGPGGGMFGVTGGGAGGPGGEAGGGRFVRGPGDATDAAALGGDGVDAGMAPGDGAFMGADGMIGVSAGDPEATGMTGIGAGDPAAEAAGAESGFAGEAGSGVGGMPMMGGSAAQQRDKERHRQAWMAEEADLWESAAELVPALVA